MSARPNGLTAMRWGGLRRVVAGVALTALAVGGLSAMTIASPQAAEAAVSPSQQWLTTLSPSQLGAVGQTMTGQFGTTGVSAAIRLTGGNAVNVFPRASGSLATSTGTANVLNSLEPDPPANSTSVQQGVGQPGSQIVETITFSKPVLDPILHVVNLDGSYIDVTGNTTAGTPIQKTTLAQNADLDYSGTTRYNNSPSTANLQGCQSGEACGSIQLGGLVKSFQISNVYGAAGDTWNWSLSFPTAPLTKQFSPSAIKPGGTSQLTFTIANPANSEQPTLTPLDFTDELPAGVTLKDDTFTNNGNCGAPTSSGNTVGSDTVTAGNITVAAGATCTITVNVTASTLGTYTNDNSNLSTTVGNLVPNANTSLTVTDADIPTVTCTTDPVIFNTGYDVATGGKVANNVADARWTVAGGFTGLNYVGTTVFPAGPSAAALPPAGTTYAPALAGKVNNLWSDSQSGKSQWISADYVPPTNGQNQATGYGDWYYRYQFNLDPQVDPSTFQLDMSWLSDNTVAGVWVNNQAQTGANLPQDPNNAWGGGGFASGNAATTSMAGDWKTGLNTILVQVKSFYPAEGFNAEVTSSALCPPPALTIAKSAENLTSGDNSKLAVGDKVEYTVTAKNTAKVAFTADNPAQITDDMSDVIDDATLDQSSLKATVDGQTVDAPTFNSPTLSWSGPLDPGVTVTLTYTVTYNGDGNAKLVNNACVPDGTQTTGTNPCATVNLPAPRIVPWKTVEASSTPVQAGTTLTYTLHFENTGSTAGSVNQVDDLTDVLDDATVTTEPATATGPLTATRNGNRITVTGNLDAGQTSTITYTVTVNPADDRGNNRANNYLVGTTPPPTTCTPTDAQRPDCTSTPISALVPGKTVDPESGSSVVAGQVLTYTLTFDNSKGTADAPVTDYTDDLSKVLDDADVTTQPTTTMDTLEIGPITNGSFPVTGTVPAGKVGTVTYKVTVNANGARGDDTLDNSLLHPNDPPVETHNPVRAYSVEKTASDGPVHAGDTVTYTVTVKNTGTAAYTTAKPATVTDDLSKVLDDATYVDGSATNGATVSGTTLTWSGPLPVGASETITYQVKAGPAGTGDGTLTNVVTPDLDNGGSCATEGGCTTTTLLQAFTVKKTSDATEVTPGAKVTYTITVTNTGKADYTAADPASFTDDMSKVLDDATYNGDATGGATYAAPTLSWAGALKAGATTTVTYSVTVDDPDTGDKVLDNAVVTPPGGNCPTATTDNPDCRSLVPNGSYEVTKTADKDTVKPGGKVTYTVTVQNTGAVAYTAEKPAAFRDDLTNVLDDAAYNKDASEGATVDGNTLTWSGPLAVGQTVQVTYSVTVSDPDNGNRILVNAVVPTVPGGSCDPDGSCMTHTPVKAFTVTKTVDTTAAVKPGQKVSYTVTVKNIGGFAFTDASPASFTDDMSDVLDDATYNDDATNGATLQGTTLTWSGPLEVGQTITVEYSVTVKPAGSGNGKLVNSVDPPVDGSCDPAGTCRTDTPIAGAPVPPKPIIPGLAFTGTELVGPGIGLALMLLALGGGLLIVRRRRQQGDETDNA